MAVDPLEFEEPVAILLKEIQAMRLMPQTPERQATIAQTGSEGPGTAGRDLHAP